MKTQLLQPTPKKRWLQALLLFLLALALLLPRMLELSRYVTVDEPLWLIRSANFYRALAAGDWKETFQREHPGVTIMWAGTIGFLLRFPDYARLADTQVVNPEALDEFLGQHQHTSLGLLVAGRLVAVLGVTLAVLLALPFLMRLVGWLPATLAIFLVALDPYFIALSRLLHLDGPVAAWMLLSLLSFMSYLYTSRRRVDLLVSAVSAGLAWLTKSPALFLIPFCCLLALLELLGQWRQSGWIKLQQWRAALADIWQAGRPYLLWLLLGSALFVLLWPAMWVDPLNSLSRIFSQATFYAAEGQDSATFFMGAVYQAGQSPWFFYPVSLLWRLMPPVTIGLLLALLALLFPRQASLLPEHKRVILSFEPVHHPVRGFDHPQSEKSRPLPDPGTAGFVHHSRPGLGDLAAGCAGAGSTGLAFQPLEGPVTKYRHLAGDGSRSAGPLAAARAAADLPVLRLLQRPARRQPRCYLGDDDRARRRVGPGGALPQFPAQRLPAGRHGALQQGQRFLLFQWAGAGHGG